MDFKPGDLNSMSDVALELDHVYKKFKKGEIYDSLRDLIPALSGRMFKKSSGNLESREFWATNDVSFQVKRAEAFGIMGSNGAGKSTILKLLSGIMKPNKGRIVVNGKLSALIEVGAGFHPDLTGRENIFLNGTILGMKREEIKTKLDAIIDFSGLEDFIDTPVKRYSSGMYARLGFSVAAHVDPDILLIDEVLSVGDYQFQRQCVEKMRSVIHNGVTVIFISHNLKAISELCTRSVLLDHGRVLKEGPTDEVIRTYIDHGAEKSDQNQGKQAYISSVKVRNRRGETVQFESGEPVWVDIEVIANTQCDKVSIGLQLKDDSYYEIFNTSTERLGCEWVSLKAGEKFSCTFELELVLAWNTFHLGVFLYRYLLPPADAQFPAATFFVSSQLDVRGVVNLNPKVLSQEIESNQSGSRQSKNLAGVL